MNKATAFIILEKRWPNKQGFPVKLRVVFNRKYKDFSIGYSCTEEDYDKIKSDKPRNEWKEKLLMFNSIVKKATDIINDLPDFTFEKFTKHFTTKRSDQNNVFFLLQESTNRLLAEDRPGTASSYQCSLNSLKKFTTKDSLRFEDITIDFLNAYEKWHTKEGNSLTTVGIYLRNLRTLFNDAIEAGTIKKEIYPFHKRGYQIPSGSNVKKALALPDLAKIFNYEASMNATEAFCLALWQFSYLSNGMNIKDIARLKYKNIDGDFMTFIRAKTERTTKKDAKLITVVLTEESKAIIEKFGNKPKNQDSYIFPILTDGITSKRERELIQQQVKTINKYIKKISEAQGIEKHVTTYTARHSFSTVLKQSGAPIELISEALGHSDTKTTKNYLDSFEHETKKEWAAKLTAFK